MKAVLIEIWGTGGTAPYAAGLAHGLRAAGGRGDEVHLIVPVGYAHDPAGCSVHRILPELRGARVGGKLANAFVLSWRRLRQARHACRAIDRIAPEVVHLLGTSGLTRELLQLARKLRAKLVVTVHDLPDRRRAPGQWLFDFWSRNFPLADHILVHGEWSRSELEARYGREAAGRASIVPIGVYDYGRPSASRTELRCRFGLPLEAPVILFFGSHRKDKGLDILIEAAARERSGRVHLFVVGAQPARSEPSPEWYHAIARRSGVSRRITWLNRYVEDREVPDVIACVDAVALPYRQYFAGQSAVLSVAAAYDVPVLASDVGDIGPTVRQYGLGNCFQAESVAELSDALGDVGAGSIVWNGRRSREYAAATDWQQIGRQLWTLYHTLATHRG